MSSALSESTKSKAETSEMERVQKIKSLKKRIVGIYGSSLLTSPLETQTLHKIFKDDSAAEKARKKMENNIIIKDRAAELKHREPELILELEKLIERIKTARQDYGAIENLYVSSNAALSTQKFVCEQCGNKDINNIIMDSLRGDSICNGVDNQGCGYVITDHTVEMGAEKRNFEGEEDRNHFGPAPNKLMPDVVNMETSLNIHVNGRENALWKRLSQTQQTVEMNLSKIGKEDKHTREGYKTRQKRQAFALMEEIAANINIHQAVVLKAKEEFTKYRDIRDALHQFEGVVSACLVLAYEELSLVMSLDEVKKSAEITSDIGRMDTTYRPQVVIFDAATGTLPDTTLSKFSAEQLKEWLVAVANNVNTAATALASVSDDMLVDDNNDSSGAAKDVAQYLSAANHLHAHVLSLMTAEAAASVNQPNSNSSISSSNSSNSSVGTTRPPMHGSTRGIAASTSTSSDGRKRVRPSLLDGKSDNIFGTVTVSSRLNRYKGSGTAAATSTAQKAVHSLTAGQHILRINIAHVLQHNLSGLSTMSASDLAAVAAYFKDAVSRRSLFDTSRVEAERVAEMQTKRLKIEVASGLISRTANKLSSANEHDDSLSGWSTSNSGVSLHSNGGVNSSAFSSTSSLNQRLTTVSVNDVDSSSSTSEKMSLSERTTPAAADEGDFSLEDLMGGPVATTKTSSFALHSSASTATASTKITTSASGSAGVAAGGSVAGGVSSSPTAAPAVPAVKEEVHKKVGMKPRPRFVIN